YEEREPAPALAALHALQQEAVRAAVDLQERRHGRLEIGEDLAAHRDQIAARNEGAELVARWPRGPGARSAREASNAGGSDHSAATTERSTPGLGRVDRAVAGAAPVEACPPDGRSVDVPALGAGRPDGAAFCVAVGASPCRFGGDAGAGFEDARAGCAADRDVAAAWRPDSLPLPGLRAAAFSGVALRAPVAVVFAVD